MKPTFDLVSEGWIPCLMPTGEVREVGLLEALTEAHDIVEITDASPPVVASVHRLLLAILHRNFGPANVRAWRDLWRAGAFDRGVLEGYFQQWRHRFDLFDAERPFYQVPGLNEALLRPMALLAQERVSGNNAALFDHSSDDVTQSVAAATAARLVVVANGYAAGGRFVGAAPRKSTTHAPLLAAAVFLVTGKTLFETLMLNAVIYDAENAHPLPADGDCPAWEADAGKPVEVRQPRGYLDYLTWQSRRLWLKPEQDAEGDGRVSRAVITNGREFPRGHFIREDPMVAYRRVEKAKPDDNPCPALRLTEDRALWRDSMALLQSVPDKRWRPAVLGHLADRIEDGTIPETARYELAAMGLCSKKAKVMFWRHERQPLPLEYLTKPHLVERLGWCLDKTEETALAFDAALWKLAAEMLPAHARKEDVQALTRGFGTTNRYWAELEPAFHRLVLDLADQSQEPDRVSEEWLRGLLRVAHRLLDGLATSLKSDGRTLRAGAAAQRMLSSRLAPLTKELKEEVNHAIAE